MSISTGKRQRIFYNDGGLHGSCKVVTFCVGAGKNHATLRSVLTALSTPTQ